MTSNVTTKKYSHLSYEERTIIEYMLKESYSITKIAETLSRDKTTISKEIKKHRQQKESNMFNNNSNCIYRSTCKEVNKYCNKTKPCFDSICKNLKKSPYVCNGCNKRVHCRNTKYFYDARNADNDYKDILTNSRIGIRLSKEEERKIENVIYTLIKDKNQSVNEIYINNPDLLTFSKPTFYSYVNQGVFHLKNIDLRRKVTYKARVKQNKRTRLESKIRVNRTYKDFLEFISKHPNMNIVEMDTVEGIKGGKLFLTLFFRENHLMLIFLLNNKTKESVTKVFNNIKKILGIKTFRKLFRIILTDNGGEFFDPDSIECINGKKIINIFYCDPCASWQKGKIEKNHEYIRYILPKGSTFNFLINEDISLLMSNINNSPRGSLNNKSPYNSFKEKYGQEILDKFNIQYIKPNDVNLSKKLLNNHNQRKKVLIKLINDLEYYYQIVKKVKIDNNIKMTIIDYFINDWYLYTEDNLFIKSKEIINNLINTN